MLRKDPYALEINRVLQRKLHWPGFNAISTGFTVSCPQIGPWSVVMCLLQTGGSYRENMLCSLLAHYPTGQRSVLPALCGL